MFGSFCLRVGSSYIGLDIKFKFGKKGEFKDKILWRDFFVFWNFKKNLTIIIKIFSFKNKI